MRCIEAGPTGHLFCVQLSSGKDQRTWQGVIACQGDDICNRKFYDRDMVCVLEDLGTVLV